MKIEKPEFFLASTEGYDLEEPRRCLVTRRLRGTKRDDYLLIRIDPPIHAQNSGLATSEIDEVIIATRFKEDTLFPVSQWPLSVHVARLVTPMPEGSEILHDGQLKEIAWAELYPSEERARLKK
ncbi:MAG TPA: hypothetical protein VGY98_01950 [Verrucomicrobiae bacterium]|nr:hypothetical protein [Verrucomicrobiae bacterium]